MGKNFKIAIVDDENVCVDLLMEMLARYESEKDIVFSVSAFKDVETFLLHYKDCFDIVFMDIELSGMNGMDGARRLREIDPVVVLIFITNMAQYAVQGYEVDALDYIIKPVTYRNFSVKLDRALNKIEKFSDKTVVVYGKNEITRMNAGDMIYVEVRGHHLYFHLTNREVVDVCGALGKLAEELKEYGFAQCNNCFLINLKYVDKITAISVFMLDGTELQISKRRRKAFLDEFATYMGKNV